MSELPSTSIEGSKFYLPNHLPGNLQDAKIQYYEIFIERIYDMHSDCSINEGDVVFDIGANIGIFSIYCLLERKASRAVCFEPDHYCLLALKKTVQYYGLEQKVTIVPKGVWSAQTRKAFYDEENHKWGNRIVDDNDPNCNTRIEVFTIDQAVKDLEISRIDFIKFDIEGAEREALKGMNDTLSVFMPKMAVCTYHKEDDEVVIPELVLSKNENYKVRHLTNSFSTVALFY